MLARSHFLSIAVVLEPGLVRSTRCFCGTTGRNEVGGALLAPGVDRSEELDASNIRPKDNPLASRTTAIARRVIIGGIDGFVGAINRTLLLSSGGLSEAI